MAGFWLLASIGGGIIMMISAAVSYPWFIAVFGVGFLWFGYDVWKQASGWFSIPSHKALGFDGNSLEFKSRGRPLKVLSGISFGLLQTRKRMNFMPSGVDCTMLARLDFRDGSAWCFRAGQGPFTTFGPNLGQEDTKALIEKLYTISNAAGVLPVRKGIAEVV